MKIDTNQPKHTQGKWKIISPHPVLNNLAIGVQAGRNEVKDIEKYKVICESSDWRGDAFERLEEGEAEANIHLISASPDMYEALRWAYENIKILEKQIPLKNQPNLATEVGKNTWEKFLAGMVRIEKAISKAEGK